VGFRTQSKRAGILWLGALILGAPVYAQTTCGLYPNVIASITSGAYEEKLQFRGMAVNGQVLLEIWADFDAGTWTALTVNINNVACIVMSGSGFQFFDNKIRIQSVQLCE